MSQSVGNDYRYGEDNLPDGPGRAQEDMPMPGVITITAGDGGVDTTHSTSNGCQKRGVCFSLTIGSIRDRHRLLIHHDAI